MLTKIIKPGKKESDLTVIIPTAGISRSMKRGPKALLNINGELLIERQIRLVRKTYPFADIIVVVGYGADQVAEILPKNVRIIENESFEVTNVSRSIGVGLKAAITENVLVIYGDLVFNKKALEEVTDTSCILLNKKGKPDAVGLNIQDKYVEHLSHASKTKWGHIFFLKGQELVLFRQVAYNKENGRLLGYECLNYVLERGGKFLAIENLGTVIEVDTVSDLSKIKFLESEL